MCLCIRWHEKRTVHNARYVHQKQGRVISVLRNGIAFRFTSVNSNLYYFIFTFIGQISTQNADNSNGSYEYCHQQQNFSFVFYFHSDIKAAKAQDSNIFYPSKDSTYADCTVCFYQENDLVNTV
jgi:hypothetical protein